MQSQCEATLSLAAELMLAASCQCPPSGLAGRAAGQNHLTGDGGGRADKRGGQEAEAGLVCQALAPHLTASAKGSFMVPGFCSAHGRFPLAIVTPYVHLEPAGKI